MFSDINLALKCSFINTKIPLGPTGRKNVKQKLTFLYSNIPSGSDLSRFKRLHGSEKLSAHIPSVEARMLKLVRIYVLYCYESMLTLPPCNNRFLTKLTAGKERRGLTFRSGVWCRKGLREEDSECDERYGWELHSCSNWRSGEFEGVSSSRQNMSILHCHLWVFK